MPVLSETALLTYEDGSPRKLEGKYRWVKAGREGTAQMRHAGGSATRRPADVS